MAWYEEWFGEEYLELYSHRDASEAEAHVDFVERVFAGERPEAILDLACGAGRHTDALRRRGHRALGLDLSIILLTRPPKLPRVAGDIRSLPFADSTFDWVLNFFTSFGYFEAERENFGVLLEIVRVLRPGGRFMIDLFNRDQVIAGLVPEESRTVQGSEVAIERWFDAERQRVNKKLEIRSPDGEVRSFLESVRAYSEDEVTIGLRWAGLEVTGVHGDFGGEPFEPSSPRLILVGRKP